jgi:hypothetical protein
MQKSPALFTTLLVVATALIGCHADPKVTAALLDHPDKPKVTFKSPGILKKYRAFYVAPIEIYTNDSGRLVPAEDRELDDLALTFREKIIRGLGDSFTQFNLPARDVALIEVAITDVWSTRALLNLRPGLLVPNTFEGGASMEAQVFDSITHEVIASVTDSRAGARKGFLTGLTKWGGTKAAFDSWAAGIRKAVGGRG